MSKQFTLGKDARLKSRKQTELLFSKGKRFSIDQLRVIYSYESSVTSAMKFGVAVSAKQFKKAVERNRIKRLLRECFRLQKISLAKAIDENKFTLNIFMLYSGKEMPDYQTLFPSVGKCLEKLERIVCKTT